MADLLVKLYELPVAGEGQAALPNGVRVRRAMAYEKQAVVDWVGDEFGPRWASECAVCFGPPPISCYIATLDGDIVGFACYDATCLGFFGPIGVKREMRGRGVGRALLLSTLGAMAAAGYGYAVIGGVDSAELYTKAVGAIEIPGSTPGIYTDRLKPAPRR